MLRELAQHCGHADILREQILAARLTAPAARVKVLNQKSGIEQWMLVSADAATTRLVFTGPHPRWSREGRVPALVPRAGRVIAPRSAQTAQRGRARNLAGRMSCPI
ncbi:hypothetical protein NicSoilC12_30860 [Arthrobacter sp. NicSoilC12]|nr:hypothetical protein NicSoilC12_30860 [Arthrobacter sp. NicSoilC12]